MRQPIERVSATLLLCIVGWLILFSANLAFAQQAEDGLPWTQAFTDTGAPNVCGTTTDAATCATEGAGVACAWYAASGLDSGWCGSTATSCTVWGINADYCSMSNGMSGVEVATADGQFFVSTHPYAQADCGCSDNTAGDPMSPANGNVSYHETDISAGGAGSPAFERYYNSADSSGTALSAGWRYSFSRQIIVQIANPYQPYSTTDPMDSYLYSYPAEACDYGWYDVRATSVPWAAATPSYSGGDGYAYGVCTLSLDGTVVATPIVFSAFQIPGASTTPIGFTAQRDDGQQVTFTLSGSTIVAPTGITLQLSQTESGGYQLIDDDDNVESYNANGQLTSVTTRAGIAETLAYNSSNQLSTVTDSFGHQLTLAYNGGGQLASVTDPNGNTVQYGFDSQGRLSTITNLDGTSRSYVYENSSFPSALTGIIDESGTRYSTWAYNAQAQGSSSQEAGGADATTLTYNGDNSVTATDALGNARTFTFNVIGQQNRVVSISGSQCPTCQEPAATTYDSAGFVNSRTDYNGNLTCYANDPVRGLELERVEGFAPGSSCPSNLASYTPASGTLQRMISTSWSSTYRLPTQITESNRTTAFTYDSSGNLLTKTITDTSVSPNVSRTWTYTYNSYGQVLTAKGPRTDLNSTTTYTYYSCATGGHCGQVHTVTDPVGNETTYNTYNAYGNPLTLTDPNSVVTTLAYDARERLSSRQVSTETTSFGYYPTGLLEQMTLPDTSDVVYTYDGAHRLTQLTDSAGNSIQYTLDAMGNRTAENTYDPSGTLHRTHSRAFNTLSELYQDINAANTSAVTTTFGYDSNGNQTSIAAPLSRNTSNAYDALNRLNQITDPNSGNTYLSYDTSDDLTSVQDPNGLTTSYSYNGFKDLIQQVSPDTGTSSDTYDSGGNLGIATDARGSSANYSYDAANRVTSVVYKNSSGVSDQTLAFTYDTGTDGKGRLTNASDANHSLTWTYDFMGRVTGKGLTVGSVTRSVGYGYTNGDLTAMTTPSGQGIVYGYNSNHQVTSITVNGTTLVSGVTYEPFGGVNGWTWGNSTTVSRSFNGDGIVSQIVTAGVTLGYSYDNANRISGISDSSNSALSWSYGYDLLDRLTSASTSANSYGWTYDSNGNRLSQTDTNASTFSTNSGTNQLGSTSGSLVRTYVLDAAGNTTAYGSLLFTYNNRGRMMSTNAASYLYNALGQMIEKSGSAGTTIFMQDEAGHLIGEYNGSGGLIEETVWLGDIPVATLQPDPVSGIDIYYVHTDQLNSPRKISRPSDNQYMWRWDADAFGTASPNQNPAGLGTLIYNLLRLA
jgi:YD repeat-containing protein